MEKFKDFRLKLLSNAEVIGVLSNNLEILKKESRFHDYYEFLVSNHKKLIDLNLRFSKDISSQEKSRMELRNELIDKTMKVIHVMQVFAADKKKKNLQLRLEHLSREFLQDSSDIDLIKISKRIWLIANKHGGYAMTFINRIKAALNPENTKINLKFEKKYGLIPDMIKNIEEVNVRFIKSVVSYQVSVKEKQNLSLEMKRIFKDSKKLLAKKIDKFVLLNESKNPQFFKEYSRVREKQLQKIISGINHTEIDTQELASLGTEDELVLSNALPKSKPKSTTIINR